MSFREKPLVRSRTWALTSDDSIFLRHILLAFWRSDASLYLFRGLTLPGMILSASQTATFNLNKLRGRKLLSLLYRWGIWGTARLSNMPKATQLVRGSGSIQCRGGLEPKFSNSMLYISLGHNGKCLLEQGGGSVWLSPSRCLWSERSQHFYKDTSHGQLQVIRSGMFYAQWPVTL